MVSIWKLGHVDLIRFKGGKVQGKTISHLSSSVTSVWRVSRFVRWKFSCGRVSFWGTAGRSRPDDDARTSKKKSEARSCERLQEVPSDRPDNSIIRAIGFSAPSIRSKLFRTTKQRRAVAPYGAHRIVWHRGARKNKRLWLRNSETFRKIDTDIVEDLSEWDEVIEAVDGFTFTRIRPSFRLHLASFHRETRRNNLADCSLKCSDELFLCSTAISGSIWFNKLNIVLIKRRHVIVRINGIMCNFVSIKLHEFYNQFYRPCIYREFGRKERKETSIALVIRVINCTYKIAL